jgi:hypothetical protein
MENPVPSYKKLQFLEQIPIFRGTVHLQPPTPRHTNRLHKLPTSQGQGVRSLWIRLPVDAGRDANFGREERSCVGRRGANSGVFKVKL